MRKIIHKLFWVWQFEEEEKWLNEMASQGLSLVSVGFLSYEFETGLPAEYTVRLQILEHWPTNPVSQQYIEFIEQTGAEHVGSMMRWVYFRKKKEEGPFPLYSDLKSKIKQLNLILALIITAGSVNVLNTFFSITVGLSQGRSANLILGIALLAFTLLIGWGGWKIWRKRQQLKKELRLRE